MGGDATLVCVNDDFLARRRRAAASEHGHDIEPGNVGNVRIVARDGHANTRRISNRGFDAANRTQSSPVRNDPVTVAPTRVSLSETSDPGGLAPAMNDVCSPAAFLDMNSTWPSGSRSRMTCGESAASVSRSITPALANGCVSSGRLIRATISTSPLAGWDTYRNASAVPQTSAHEPAIKNAPVCGA